MHVVGLKNFHLDLIIWFGVVGLKTIKAFGGPGRGNLDHPITSMYVLVSEFEMGRTFKFQPF